jgi:protein O-mannosyl-transferase
MAPADRLSITAGAAVWLLLALAGLLLAPGLTGHFIFDDSWNLRGLEEIDRNPTLGQALDYATSGFSSRLGRPLTLATFAAQYADWPWHPSAFLRANIALHLIAGAFLCWWLLRLTVLMRLPASTGTSIAVLASALWLLAPLQASATLYVIQRMAVLSGVCMFAGLLLYTVGRARFAEGRSRAGIAWCSAGLAVGAGLGTLSKENAALLPLGILVLEWTLLATVVRTRAWRLWAAAFLGLPTAALLAYLAWSLPDFIAGYAGRGFTLGERLMTEARVLFLYLHKLFFPSISSVRLLYDDLPVSHGLWSPPTTLFSIAGWIVAVAVAVRWRHRFAPLSFAILWFLAQHVLESSIVPLELAFEHRNYVASAGPVLAAAWYAHAALASPALRRVRPLIAGGTALYLAFTGAALAASASLWGRPVEMFEVWGREQPDSPRAQLTLADTYLLTGRTGAAAATLERAIDKWPGDFVFPLAFLQIGCSLPGGPLPSLNRFRDTAARFDGQVLATINILDRLVSAVEHGYCDTYSHADWRAILDIIGGTPQFDWQAHNLELLRSRIAEAFHERALAREHLDRAIRLRPLPSLLQSGVIWALDDGDIEAARRYVRLAREQAMSHPLQRLSAIDHADRLAERVEQAARAGER